MGAPWAPGPHPNTKHGSISRSESPQCCCTAVVYLRPNGPGGLTVLFLASGKSTTTKAGAISRIKSNRIVESRTKWYSNLNVGSESGKRKRTLIRSIIGQDSGRVLTRTLGEYFSGVDPRILISQIDHHGPLLAYSPRLLRPLGLPLHGPPITAGQRYSRAKSLHRC